MSDVTLSDGRELTGDLSKITVTEYRNILSANRETFSQEQEDEMIGRVFGLSGEEVAGLSFPDYRRVTKTFFKLATAPLDDGDKKNSESASTST